MDDPPQNTLNPESYSEDATRKKPDSHPMRIAAAFASADHASAHGLNEKTFHLTFERYMRKLGASLTLRNGIVHLHDRANQWQWRLEEIVRNGSTILTEEQHSIWQIRIQEVRHELSNLEPAFMASEEVEGEREVPTCVICGKTYNQQQGLKRHVRFGQCGGSIQIQKSHVPGSELKRAAHKGPDQDSSDDRNPAVKRKRATEAPAGISPLPIETAGNVFRPTESSREQPTHGHAPLNAHVEIAGSSETRSELAKHQKLQNQLAAQTIEIEQLKRHVASRDAEIIKQKEYSLRLQRSTENTASEEKALYKGLLDQMDVDRKMLEERQRQQYLDRERDLNNMSRSVRTFIGEVDLPRLDKLPLPVNKSFQALGSLARNIFNDTKALSFFEGLQFDVQRTLPRDVWSPWASLISTICGTEPGGTNGVSLQLKRLNANGIPSRCVFQALASAAVCILVFSTGTSSFNDQKWLYSDEYWELFIHLGGDMNSVRKLAICIHRTSIDYMQKQVIPNAAKTLAGEFSAMFSSFFPDDYELPATGPVSRWGQSERDVSSRQERIGNCLEDALNLVSVLELSTKEHSFVFFAPGTNFDDRYMEAEDERGVVGGVHAVDLTGKKVGLCLSPALIECPETDLRSLNGGLDFERALPTSKRFLHQSERLGDAGTKICAKSVVLLQ